MREQAAQPPPLRQTKHTKNQSAADPGGGLRDWHELDVHVVVNQTVATGNVEDRPEDVVPRSERGQRVGGDSVAYAIDVQDASLTETKRAGDSEQIAQATA